MSIYISVLYLLSILSILEIFTFGKQYIVLVKFNEKQKKIEFWKSISIIVVIILIIISATREVTVGRDLMNYIPRYEKLGKANWSELFEMANQFSFEYGYAILNKIMYIINPSPYFFIFVTSIIIGLGFYLLSRYTKFPILMLFIIYSFGIYGSSMNVIRQFIAFTILVLSIPFIYKRRFGYFLGMIVLATSIHSASIIFIILYFLYDVRFSKKTISVFLTMCIILTLFGKKMVYILISKTSFAWYLTKDANGSGESTLIMLLLILIGAYCVKIRIVQEDNYANLWIWGVAIAILFNSLALSLGVFARVMKFFLPFVALLIVDILLAIRKNRTQYIIANISVILFFSIYFLLIILGNTAIGEGWGYYISKW